MERASAAQQGSNPSAREGGARDDAGAGTEPPQMPPPSLPRVVLRLYVTGGAPRSGRAVHNLRSFCETHLHGRYDLAVIDIFQQPWLASEAQLVAAPTLVKELPLPPQRFVGIPSDTSRFLERLGLVPELPEGLPDERSDPPA